MTEPNTLTRISEHVYVFSPDSRTDRPSLAAVVGAKSTLLLDVGNSEAHTRLFLNALAQQGIPAPRYAALTHWHWDHVFGASALDVPLIAHRETARQLAIQAAYDWSDAALDARVEAGLETAFCRDMLKLELPDRSDLRIVVPDILFDDQLTVDLGGVTCDIRHVGGDHAADSTIMHIPQDCVLFLGDCMYDAIYAPARHYTTRKLFPLLDTIAAYDAGCAVVGHHPEVVSREELDAWMYDLRLIGAAVDELGADKAAVLARVAGKLRDEQDIDEVDTFIAGVGM